MRYLSKSRRSIKGTLYEFVKHGCEYALAHPESDHRYEHCKGLVFDDATMTVTFPPSPRHADTLRRRNRRVS